VKSDHRPLSEYIGPSWVDRLAEATCRLRVAFLYEKSAVAHSASHLEEKVASMGSRLRGGALYYNIKYIRKMKIK
jgi:hypothetical protein